jgi:hypothetical protein
MNTLTNVLDPDPLTSDIAPTTPPSDLVENTNEPPSDTPKPVDNQLVAYHPARWRAIIRGDVVAKTRDLINACRKSPQRRQSLHVTITVGKEEGKWECRALQLLRDVDTRWSSIYLMIDRYIYLHPVSIQFKFLVPVLRLTNSTQAVNSWILQAGLQKYLLNKDEITILKEIKEFLHHFHEFQELLSVELTPAIYQVFPTFYVLISNLEKAQKRQPVLSHAYNTALLKLREYLAKCRRNPVYTLALG